jgi:hypothetical protein
MLRLEAFTICTATASEAVFTVRTYAAGRDYEPLSGLQATATSARESSLRPAASAQRRSSQRRSSQRQAHELQRPALPCEAPAGKG